MFQVSFWSNRSLRLGVHFNIKMRARISLAFAFPHLEKIHPNDTPVQTSCFVCFLSLYAGFPGEVQPNRGASQVVNQSFQKNRQGGPTIPFFSDPVAGHEPNKTRFHFQRARVKFRGKGGFGVTSDFLFYFRNENEQS